MSEELKPCPFCNRDNIDYGYDWKYYDCRDDVITPNIECPCGALFQGESFDLPQVNTINSPREYKGLTNQDEIHTLLLKDGLEKEYLKLKELWNTRPIEDALRTKNEQLKERVKKVEKWNKKQEELNELERQQNKDFYEGQISDLKTKLEKAEAMLDEAIDALAGWNCFPSRADFDCPVEDMEDGPVKTRRCAECWKQELARRVKGLTEADDDDTSEDALRTENERLKADAEDNHNQYIALKRLIRGEKYGCSTFIDETTTTYGYGELNSHGWFEFPLYADDIAIVKSMISELESRRRERNAAIERAEKAEKELERIKGELINAFADKAVGKINSDELEIKIASTVAKEMTEILARRVKGE